MKSMSALFLSCNILAILAQVEPASVGQTATITDDQAIEVVRSAIKANRESVVTEALQLTTAESEKFWPLYRQYRADMTKIGDELVRLMQSYATFYPDVPQQAAERMLKKLTELEDQQASTRAEYLKKMTKVMPASKTLRFAQVENRLDLALRVELASKVPLVPIAGELRASSNRGAAAVEGVPGGVVVETHELTAKVTAIDRANRRLYLLSPDGIKQTVKVGPEAVNFDQIRPGDTLRVKATEELVVQMADPGDSATSESATAVALAPKGAKPGGVISETTEFVATVRAIDQQKHTATLRFEDGSEGTFPVRKDVDLGERKVGERVLIRLTESIALSMTKP
jgi:hypothetical protein